MKLNPETIAHIQVCDWLSQKTDLPFYHFVQEGKRTFTNASILHRMGFKAGVADIFIPRKSNGLCGLWLELKVGRNKPTEAQAKFLEDMTKEGYAAVCVWGAEAAILFIKEFYNISENDTNFVY